MGETGAKKLGEVWAFAKVGLQTLEQGFSGFRKLFSEVKLEDLKKANEEHIKAIESLATEIKILELVSKKGESTVGKLSAMRDLYIKENWDNPAELCEWLGFFEGAAVVHWTFLKGVAEGSSLKNLEELADKAIIFHEEILKTSSLCLYNIGKEKSE